MTQQMTKIVNFYHPVLSSNFSLYFSDILKEISEKGSIDIKASENDHFIVVVSTYNEFFVITIQNLKNDELPKVANSINGKDEQDLTIPQGKSLSYKNIFVYDRRKGIMACAVLSNCPQIGKLRACLQNFCSDNNLITKKSDLTFQYIMDHDLVERLKNANKITTATFTSKDYYDGDDIKEKHLEAYKDYLCGHNYYKTTKIKGRKGENIKSIVQSILDDIIGNNDMPESLDISMEIDGEKINFKKYYKKRTIQVNADMRNTKYIDYDNLKDALINCITNEESTYAE